MGAGTRTYIASHNLSYTASQFDALPNTATKRLLLTVFDRLKTGNLLNRTDDGTGFVSVQRMDHLRMVFGSSVVFRVINNPGQEG